MQERWFIMNVNVLKHWALNYLFELFFCFLNLSLTIYILSTISLIKDSSMHQEFGALIHAGFSEINTFISTVEIAFLAIYKLRSESCFDV